MKLKSEAWNSKRSFHMDGKKASSWTIMLCFPDMSAGRGLGVWAGRPWASVPTRAEMQASAACSNTQYLICSTQYFGSYLHENLLFHIHHVILVLTWVFLCFSSRSFEYLVLWSFKLKANLTTLVRFLTVRLSTHG